MREIMQVIFYPYDHIAIAILAMIRPHLGWHIVPLKLLKFIFIHIYGGGRGAKYFEKNSC